MGKEWVEDFLPYDKKKKDNRERALVVGIESHFVKIVPAKIISPLVQCFQKSRGVVEISEKLGLEMPAYYTYHPNYLQLKGKLDSIVEKLITDMNGRSVT